MLNVALSSPSWAIECFIGWLGLDSLPHPPTLLRPTHQFTFTASPLFALTHHLCISAVCCTPCISAVCFTVPILLWLFVRPVKCGGSWGWRRCPSRTKSPGVQGGGGGSLLVCSCGCGALSTTTPAQQLLTSPRRGGGGCSFGALPCGGQLTPTHRHHKNLPQEQNEIG